MRKILTAVLILVLLLSLRLPHLSRPVPHPRSQTKKSIIVRLYVHEADKVELIPLEDYVVGVVAAEMPASFSLEALKAQAVAARTYVIKRMLAKGVVNSEHPGTDISDDPTKDQAWISNVTMRERWGSVNYAHYYYKIRLAVDDTIGEIITYQGQPIDPVFSADCGGHTENSEDVWASAVPYLQGVSCPYDADPQPVQWTDIPITAVDAVLGVDLQAVPITTAANQPIKVLAETATGRPKTLLVDGRQISASEMREKLGLYSTDFSWQFKGDQLEFKTVGCGHGVGMCQYGAQGFAEHGYNYQQILKHYYTGVQIEPINSFYVTNN